MTYNSRLDIPPFLSYAGSYALFNYTTADPAKGLAYDNLRLVRAFEKGLDPKSSEAGFILTHVDMVNESGRLVSGAMKVIETLEHSGPRSNVNEGFREILQGMEKIEASMEGKFYPIYEQVRMLRDIDMWANSKPSEYLSFRVFIFGITSQSMFPNGVVYEGCYNNKPLNFRGESGANDSIVSVVYPIRRPRTDNGRFLFWTTSSRSRCPPLLSPRSSTSSAPTGRCLTVSSSLTFAQRPSRSASTITR